MMGVIAVHHQVFLGLLRYRANKTGGSFLIQYLLSCGSGNQGCDIYDMTSSKDIIWNPSLTVTAKWIIR
ncbi:hypothetical protein [Rubritalea tangerina]|uniref:hypothetical protein n=1 Tax=Rubritalea tangerina TaxID=430798 RepID=UPI00360F785F